MIGERPRYVQQLDGDRRAAKAELAALEDGLRDLRIYLSSAKFHAWPYVNVQDVLNRLDDAHLAGIRARGEAA